jgi:hypothetical protein
VDQGNDRKGGRFHYQPATLLTFYFQKVVTMIENGTLEIFPAMQRMLPDDQIIIANAALRILSLIRRLPQPPRQTLSPLLAQELFTPIEWHVLLVLLHAYPQAISREAVYAALHDLAPEYSRQQLDTARDQGYFHEELRSVRNVISRLRQKVAPFALGIVFEQDQGYRLLVHPEAFVS